MGFEDFDKDIKTGLKSTYLFYGPEKYLIEQYLEKMIEQYVPETYRDFNLTTYDGEKISLDELLDTCETMPFFNENKVVIVKNTTYFRSKKSGISEAEEERLMAYMAEPSATSHLFFVSNQAVDKRKKLTKALQKHGGMVEFEKLREPIFYKWVYKKIKQHKKDISQEHMKYLVDRIAYLDKNATKGLLDVDNEIKMICSSVQNRVMIEPSDVDPFVKKPLDSDIFMLVEAVGTKKAETAVLQMHELLANGEPIQVIFTMVARQFRLLKKTKMLMNEGYNQASIAKVTGLHPYVVKNVMRQIHLFKDHELTQLIEKCSDIDYKMKSTAIDPVLALEALIVSSCYL